MALRRYSNHLWLTRIAATSIIFIIFIVPSKSGSVSIILVFASNEACSVVFAWYDLGNNLALLHDDKLLLINLPSSPCCIDCSIHQFLSTAALAKQLQSSSPFHLLQKSTHRVNAAYPRIPPDWHRRLNSVIYVLQRRRLVTLKTRPRTQRHLMSK